MSKLGSNYICLAVIFIQLVFKNDKKYYTQVFLKECKYNEKEKLIIKYVTDDLEILSDDSDEEN